MVRDWAFKRQFTNYRGSKVATRKSGTIENPKLNPDPASNTDEREVSSPLTTRAKKFTAERIRQIINLVERGKSRDEIADILEVTVGSLQVTCSRLGISLKRPKIINGVGLPWKRRSLPESHHPSDHNGRVPLQPTEEQSHGNSQLERAEPVVIGKPQEWVTTPDACSANFAIRFQYRGRERTAELPFAPHVIGQLALEAALQDVKIGELIAELITAMVRNKDLFSLVLDNIDPATDRIGGSATRYMRLEQQSEDPKEPE
jgi:hypothetical protein